MKKSIFGFTIILCLFLNSNILLAEKLTADKTQIEPKPEQKETSSTEPRTTVIIPLKHTKAKDMKEILSVFLSLKIYADEDRNVISIYDTDVNIEEAKKVIFANDIPYKQVIISVNAAEVSHSKSKKLGWELTNYSVSLQTILPPKVNTLGTNSISEIFPGIVSFGDESADVNIILIINEIIIPLNPKYFDNI